MIAKLIIPAFIIFAFVFAAIKKVDVYDAFSSGVKQTVPLVLSIFPFLTAVFIMTELMDASGLTSLIEKFLSPVFSALKIPPELTRLILIKPFSGSGSLALLTKIYEQYGPDAYISRCASCIYGSSETIFYVSALYFSACKKKNLFLPVAISLVATFLSVIAACFFCRQM